MIENGMPDGTWSGSDEIKAAQAKRTLRSMTGRADEAL
jgi:hypothetical protein